MTRKEFTRDVVERVLIRCRRHCCVCEKLCGTKIELHHIESPEDNTENNAIPVCFDCHAEIKNYDETHPKGRKFQPSELRKLRDATFRKYSDELTMPTGHVQTDYGKGFHEGMDLAQERINAHIVWNFISRHGDFAIEILVMFGDDDDCSMMDETLYDDSVATGSSISQDHGHSRAWDVGIDIGLWNLDADKERLYLTQRGKFFRDMVRSTPELRRRYQELKAFWSMPYTKRPKDKPGARPLDYDFAPGWIGWLQVMQYAPVSLKDYNELFILLSVGTDEIILKSIESPKKLKFPSESIKEIEADRNTGITVLDICMDMVEEF